jgi:hypothetical protein
MCISVGEIREARALVPTSEAVCVDKMEAHSVQPIGGFGTLDPSRLFRNAFPRPRIPVPFLSVLKARFHSSPLIALRAQTLNNQRKLRAAEEPKCRSTWWSRNFTAA